MERDHLEDLSLDGKILKWIFKKMDGEIGLIVLGIRTGGGCL
jgi:hypothetical protein